MSLMTQTILTVDDSRTMRDMLRMALAEAGFNVLQAVDGVHGLEVLQTSMPDVIVTDINMPKMDGFGLIEAVRKDARYRRVPILVLTTESDGAKKMRAKEAGATGWIVKPFEPTKLIAAIRRVAA
jgi:two-component system, chemotaxis family, chemotaxis protein CheY